MDPQWLGYVFAGGNAFNFVLVAAMLAIVYPERREDGSIRPLLETTFGPVVMVADEASLLEAAVCMQPEVAIIDLSLAREGGSSWLRGLRARCPELKLIVLSVHDEPGVDDDEHAAGGDGVDEQLTLGALTLDLGQLPPPALGVSSSSMPFGGFDRNERDRLRRMNNDLTKELVDLTGRLHAQVNAELNRRAGIGKVSEASIVQLNRRSRAAEDWLRHEHRRARFARFT